MEPTAFPMLGQRLRRALRLVLPDRMFWALPRVYNPNWDRRAEKAAAYIHPGSSVLDLGCGRMALRDMLPEGCQYTPADLTKWTPDTHQVDLDRGEFPPGTYDYAMLLGVIEYLSDPARVLARARESCAHLITSYNHARDGKAKKVMGMRAANDYSPDAIAELLRAAGWSIDEVTTTVSKKQGGRHFLYVCSRASQTHLGANTP